MKPSFDWLTDQNGVCGCAGEKALRGAIENAEAIVTKLKSSQDENVKNNIKSAKSLLNNLGILINEDKVIDFKIFW